ncbi:hypothetical protein TD95_002723 [Thielaviopsis punctulata]|uniref:Mitochondrial carrier n=1 Tax=Thielaviopsis punctulata TaxID=72032 RepID=A0A0F4Z803_9PEZI|nr:hypothetical protein TD95_002723 [Thielaviopsis punctulata]
MSAEFWAGYVSGAAGIVIGNPLDILKVRLQSASPRLSKPLLSTKPLFSTGIAAPIAGYGALNAVLFETYTQTLHFSADSPASASADSPGLGAVWAAGAVGGLATWAVSTPTEMVKCVAQREGRASRDVAREVWRRAGVRGMFRGGGVTVVRDAVGYGFYFAVYEGLRRAARARAGSEVSAAADTLVCGGLAGVASWVSVFPADTVKTRVQTSRMGAWDVVREMWRTEGMRGFWRGVGVCSVRGFVVNAVTWGVYEWMMRG